MQVCHQCHEITHSQYEYKHVNQDSLLKAIKRATQTKYTSVGPTDEQKNQCETCDNQKVHYSHLTYMQRDIRM